MTNKELEAYNKNRKIWQVCAITADLEATLQQWVCLLYTSKKRRDKGSWRYRDPLDGPDGIYYRFENYGC